MPSVECNALLEGLLRNNLPYNSPQTDRLLYSVNSGIKYTKQFERGTVVADLPRRDMFYYISGNICH